MAADFGAAGCPSAPVDTGAFQLQWSGPEAATFRLEQLASSDAGAQTGPTMLYEGTDEATTITGLGRGEYHYRVGVVEDGAVATWSPPCLVRVEPPDMGLTMALFCAGALVTAATVVTIVRGHRAHRAGRLG